MRTWDDIVEIEPRLGQLLKEIQAIDGSSVPFCANQGWYGRGGDRASFKMRMMLMVGHFAFSRDLANNQDYDTAYGMLYGALPDCKHDSMLC